VEAVGVPGFRAMAWRVLREALRWSAKNVRTPGARALLGEGARLVAACAGGPRAARGLRTGRAAWRLALTWLRFHRPGQSDEQLFAHYKKLWQAGGDLSVAGLKAPSAEPSRFAPLPAPGVFAMEEIPSAHLVGFHAPETWEGAAFRWTGVMAALRFERSPGTPVVTLAVVPVRTLVDDGLFVYWNGRRLQRQPEHSTPTRLVFSPVRGDRADPASEIDVLAIVCAPVPAGHGADTRVLGLPIVSVELSPS
jgi:hypothetical protein